MPNFHNLALIVFTAMSVSACGTRTPSIIQNPYSSYDLGQFVNRIALGVRCEIRDAVLFAIENREAEFLKRWSAKITMTVSAEEKTNLSPGIAAADTFVGSILTGISLNVGGIYNRSSTRKIEITWFEAFNDLAYSERFASCRKDSQNVALEGDLRIRETLLAGVYPAGNDGSFFNKFKDSAGPLDTIQNTISFSTDIGASATPTITFTNVTVNPGGTFATSNRDRMDQLLITMGPGQIEKIGRPFDKSAVRPSPQVDAAHQTGRIGLEFQSFQQRIFAP
ncbi:hypothetical protein [Methylobacterium sp. Leaf89]|uniref:hypothetical protein n=1 Tax=Methylobacterium sp. Leaf89 TaxID=1736245 RepID=UPI000A9F3A22|nr:hypothetical protein [Methylobacterium sp. Leaf89]